MVNDHLPNGWRWGETAAEGENPNRGWLDVDIVSRVIKDLL